jgi:hypothetical protein
MTVAELKQLLAGVIDGAFSISAAQLAVPGITSLFQTYLPNSTLTLRNATGEPEKLTVTGLLTLGDASDLVARAVFQADTTSTDIAGIRISCPLTAWVFNSQNLQFKVTSVGKYLHSPALTLQSVDIDNEEPEPAAILSGNIPIQSSAGSAPSVMTAPVPLTDPDNPQALVFSGEPHLKLTALNQLSQFVSTDFNIIPAGIPIAGTLELSRIGLVAGPQIDAVTAIRFDITSNIGLTIVPNLFEIDSFTFSFTVQFPAISKRVYGSVSAVMILAGEEIDVSLTIPSLFIEGSLSESTPIPLKPFLEKFASVDAIPDDFQLSSLKFGIGLTAPHNWAFEIELANLWSFLLWGSTYFTFRRLLVSATAASTSSRPDLFVMSSYSVAGTQLYLSAAENSSDWSFSGGTVGYQVINFIPLIQDLATQFNLNPDILPASLTALDFTNIQLTYNTGSTSKEFLFAGSGSLAISDVTVDATVNLDIKSSTGPNPFAIDFTGTLTLKAPSENITFNTTVRQASGQTLVIGTLNSEPSPLQFQDLFSVLGFQPSIPPGLDIALQDLGVLYRALPDPATKLTSSAFLATAKSAHYGQALFVGLKEPVAGQPPSAKTTYLFAVNPAISGSLSQLPLIGSDIPASLSLNLNSLQILFASGTLTAVQVTDLHALLTDLAQYLPADKWQVASGPLNYQAELSMGLTIGATTTSFNLGIGGPAARMAQNRARIGAAEDSTAGSAKWLTIQRSLGPLYFNRIGFSYSQGRIEFLLDASMSFAGLSLSLTDLSIGSPLTSFEPVFGLKGLALKSDSGPLSITGSFLSTTPNGLNDSTWEYAGEVIIQAAAFSIAGIGAYGKFDGNPSFFIFVLIDAPLGGPSFFFVTGLAGGFGYNRSLIVPTLENLPRFPLVAAAMAGETGTNPFQGMTNDPGAALRVMDSYLPMSVGENWVAVGVRFTSYELIQSFALISLSFGTRFEIALLGLSAITVPTLDPSPIGFAELAMEATFSPDDGVLAVAAQLTAASYVLSQSCHLTGGFAFYTWFKDNATTGAKAGDFVVSLGGYYPTFNKPKYYPAVPILGANWQVSGNLSIKGGIYFALIPSAVMAGGHLEATWQSGDLKAWFNADANFLLSWKPFHYQAEVSLSLGASYRLDLGFVTVTITVHVGVDLALWGPSFAGIAHVDLDVVSFSIRFGGENPSIAPIAWSEFKSSFLPPVSATTTPAAQVGAPVPTDTYCLVKMAAGVIADLTRTPNPEKLDWVVDPEKFQMVTSSVVPITSASLVTGSGSQQAGNQTTPLGGAFPNNFGVGPVGVGNGDLRSEHVITINKLLNGGPDYTYAVSSPTASIEQITASLPAAPWSKALSLDLVRKPSISKVNSQPATIAGLVTGFTIAPNVQPPDATPSPISLSILQETPADVTPEFSWSGTPAPSSDPFDQSQAMHQLMSTITDAGVAAKRTAILSLLRSEDLTVTSNISLGDVAARANEVLLAAPLLSYLGEERASS